MQEEDKKSKQTHSEQETQDRKYIVGFTILFAILLTLIFVRFKKFYDFKVEVMKVRHQDRKIQK